MIARCSSVNIELAKTHFVIESENKAWQWQPGAAMLTLDAQGTLELGQSGRGVDQTRASPCR